MPEYEEERAAYIVTSIIALSKEALPDGTSHLTNLTIVQRLSKVHGVHAGTSI